MSEIQTTIHGVVKIEIKEIETAVTESLGLTTVWRNIIITAKNGDRLKVTAFASRDDRENLPVSFTREGE